MRAIIIVIYDDLVCHSIKGSFMCIDATFFLYVWKIIMFTNDVLSVGFLQDVLSGSSRLDT